MHRFATVIKTAVITLLLFVNSTLLTAQTDSLYRLPVGTRIHLTLDAEINSKVSAINDTFIAIVAKPLKVRDAVVLPVGTEIEGRVTRVSRAAAGSRNGTLNVKFETLKISGRSRHIDGELVSPVRASSSRMSRLLTILGGAVIGGVLGGVSGADKGMVIGTGIGAASGTGVALLKNGKDVRIRKGDEFEIVLRSDVVLPVLDH